MQLTRPAEAKVVKIHMSQRQHISFGSLNVLVCVRQLQIPTEGKTSINSIVKYESHPKGLINRQVKISDLWRWCSIYISCAIIKK